MKKIYTSIFFATAFFIGITSPSFTSIIFYWVGLVSGTGLVYSHYTGKEKSYKGKIEKQREEIVCLANQVFWLEELLQNTLGMENFDYIQGLRLQIKSQKAEIAALIMANKGIIKSSQRLADEILSLEEANEIKYNSGFINGKLAAIKGMDITLGKFNKRIFSKPITGHEVIQESAIIVNKTAVA